MNDLYITTSIPYVNGAPHLGHALEFVHVDTLARHRRQRGAAVRTQSGTDDHAIKNVSAADAAGVPVSEFVAVNGDRFADLVAALDVHTDEFVRTSSDPRHAGAVTALWQACEQAGDLYTKEYAGLYCPGCEQYYAPNDLADGSCIEHRAPAVEITEINWFFRLSRYREQITELITTGQLDIAPATRRNEVLGFLAGNVHDLSVSRPATRSGGWGIPVPGDDSQIVYVWFDALTNYLTGLGFATSDDADFQRWWTGDVDRVHVIGKGIVRFHAVYWIAFLLSAGLPLPSRVLVHDYLTVDGVKIAKSGAQAADPAQLAAEHGVDAVRWWLLREPTSVGTTDFTHKRLVAAYNRDLANTLGNLASRTLTLSRRPRTWCSPPSIDAANPKLREQTAALPGVVDSALARYDFRAACEAIVALAESGNRFVEVEAPWLLAKAADAGDADASQRFKTVIATLLSSCRVAAAELAPFLPVGAARLTAQLISTETKPASAFPRIRP
jgi:methionyl-tRNA synthetase